MKRLLGLLQIRKRNFLPLPTDDTKILLNKITFDISKKHHLFGELYETAIAVLMEITYLVMLFKCHTVTH